MLNAKSTGEVGVDARVEKAETDAGAMRTVHRGPSSCRPGARVDKPRLAEEILGLRERRLRGWEGQSSSHGRLQQPPWGIGHA